MKTKALLFAILLSGICFTSNSSSELNISRIAIVKESGFDAFRAHRQQTGVALAWMYSSTGVANYVIQHSFDGVNFVTIAEPAPESGGWNNFRDDAALPGFNYYRVGARLNDGSIDYSDVEVVRIVRRK